MGSSGIPIRRGVCGALVEFLRPLRSLPLPLVKPLREVIVEIEERKIDFNVFWWRDNRPRLRSCYPYEQQTEHQRYPGWFKRSNNHSKVPFARCGYSATIDRQSSTDRLINSPMLFEYHDALLSKSQVPG